MKRTRSLTTSSALIALTLMTTAGFATSAHSCDLHIHENTRGGGYECQQQPKVEVVFVLDTTGSMSGLIEGAKQKIWSIASSIAQAQPAPEVKMGLVGYRDRGDAYITTKTALTDDLDTVYEKLMGFNAAGGGDTPESVNEALFEAVERFDWSDDPNTLRIVFLVGDAPPQMKYEDDVKYQASCKMASERGIIINTIQCGNLSGTRGHWTRISNLTNGAYAAIDQDSGVQRITTPYDQEITELDQELATLMIDYGDRDDRAYQHDKRARGSRVSSGAAPEASADRALYNQTAAGRANLYGKKELVNDLSSGAVAWSELKDEELPESLQGKSESELKAMIAKNSERRAKIQTRLAELSKLRGEHQSRAIAEMDGDGFDFKVLDTLEKQGASIGLTLKNAPEDKPESKPKSETKPESEE